MPTSISKQIADLTSQMNDCLRQIEALTAPANHAPPDSVSVREIYRIISKSVKIAERFWRLRCRLLKYKDCPLKEAQRQILCALNA